MNAMSAHDECELYKRFTAKRIARVLSLFDYRHLPPHLGAVSQPFHDLAHDLIKHLPGTDDALECLNELLKAKDWAVRAAVKKD